MLRIAVLLVFTFLNNYKTYSQINSQEVDELVETAMKKFNVAGVAVGMVKDGKIIHAEGYGVKSIESKDKVNEYTPFAIASNTKAFTTAALAILVDEGKLMWTDKVKDYIPEFKMYDNYVTENFNIEDLLTHRSGLGLGAGDLMFIPQGSDFTIDDILSSFQYFKPASAFRTKYDYDNLLYMVAGELISRVSGMAWEDFIAKRILEPLGMSNSYASLDGVQNFDNLAMPHLETKGKLTTIRHFSDRINGAAGGIYASVNDLCKWMLVQLQHGKYGEELENQLFSERNQNEMWKIHTTLDLPKTSHYSSHFSGYGLGWNLTDLNGNMIVYHSGFISGMHSYTLLITDLNFGIVVLTNTDPGGGALHSAVAFTILDRYLGVEDNQWMDRMYGNYKKDKEKGDRVTAEVWETVKAADDSRIDPKDYIGVYEDNWFGKFEVFMKEGRLWIKSHRSPLLNGPMRYYQANTFAIKWEYQDMNADAFAMFSLDENGKAQSIRMKGISPNIDFSFDFQDLDLKRVE